jgi:hypothetical protein
MKVTLFVTALLVAVSPFLWAQEQEGTQDQVEQGAPMTQFYEFHSLDMFGPEDFQYTPVQTDLGQFERNLVVRLQRAFPRLPGMLNAVHSFRLPDYGPLVIISLQPPTIYFTRPVLQQLEEHSRIAEAQARMVREQIDRAAQIMRLKAKESDLLEQISLVEGSKKNKKDVVAMQKDLEDIHKGLASLESPQSPSETMTINLGPSELDLDRMLSQNYQQMVDRLTVVLKNSIAETAPALSELKAGEKVCVTARIRRGLSGGADQSILFVITDSDLEAFRKGQLDLEALKQKITITKDTEK